ncbi:FAD-dependent monooxygenase [Actinoallomurus purpureus]|uniref:FAD-dependent monooxygenase n=1 Tax=Actinoallomurus purpureus TaxID=478114 RepID=UPI002092EE78|nr:FAD-dependent monooxygenase [Actinoallomurus purpureus]MCO6009297.1 FAD-dependent monooxygenase [Actinoallomurus purpureus]
MTDVLVVGGGPVGLLLAAELKRAGADPLVLEAADGIERRTRSLGLRSLNTRSNQTLALRGLLEPLLDAQWAMFDQIAADSAPDRADQVALLVSAVRQGLARGHFSGLPLLEDAGKQGAAADYILLKQHLIERILAEHATALGVPIRSGRQVIDVVDEGTGVRAVLADGTSLHAAYLVGCDGGRSTVRKQSGIDFPGTPPTATGRTAVAELADPDAVTSSLRSPGGLLDLSLVPGEIATMEFDGGPTDRDSSLTAEEMEASIRRVSGQKPTVTRLEAGIRYSDNTRLAETYRRGRVLLAGDAAHVHSPMGGQGLNLGLQDAANLGWKLALVVRGRAPERLLDTYTAERHPVAARVLRNTRAQTALMRPGPQVDALREVISEVLEIPDVKQRFIDMANGLDVDYAPQSTYPLVGRFMPALETDVRNETSAALCQGRGVLLDLKGSTWVHAAADGFADRVQVVSPRGGAPGFAAVLIRPDGYVAWASPDNGSADPAGLADALADWFGPTAS